MYYFIETLDFIYLKYIVNKKNNINLCYLMFFFVNCGKYLSLKKTNFNFKYIFLLIALNLAVLLVFCQNKEVKNVYQLKSIFIYNFAKLVGWPSEELQNEFVIGVYGYSPIVEELTNLAKSKKVEKLSIVVKKFNNSNSITKCHILYIPSGFMDDFDYIKEKVVNQKILIVTESEGALKKGAAINFVMQNNRQRFEISEYNAKKSGLVIGAELLKLSVNR